MSVDTVGAPLQRLVPAADLAVQVARVAAEISAAHPGGVLLVGVLKGSTVFLADLARRITVPVRVTFVALAPFDGESRRTRVVKDVDLPLAGEAAVLVTGTVDTGLTVDFLTRHLSAGSPRTLDVATLADKTARRLVPSTPRFRVLDAPDEYLVGYGLDLRGRFRNLPDLWVADLAALSDDLDAVTVAVYPPR